YRLVVIHEAKAKPVEPPTPPEHIPRNTRFGKEVDRRRRFNAQNFDRDLVSVRFESAVCRDERLPVALFDPQAEFFGDPALKQAISGACVNLREHPDCISTGSEHCGYLNTLLFRIVLVAIGKT